MSRRNYYHVLHVQPDAPDEVIKSSYRTLMMRLHMHPDLGGDHATATLINEAFRTLGDPQRRAVYDTLLQTRPDIAADGAAVARWHCAFCGTPHGPLSSEQSDDMCGACGAALYPVHNHYADSDSRRAIERLPRNMRLTFVRSASREVANKGVTENISLDGMRFLSNVPVDIGERLRIDCDFCSAVGVVRNTRPYPGNSESGFECGVQFLRMRFKHQRGGLLRAQA
jgi:DnaJ-class molecular chaperone